MQLKTVKGKLTTDLSVPGIVKGAVEYEIKSGTSNLKWDGPVISPAVWIQILAFFRDTYETTKSECQVRLYVNTQSREWQAWAYPQELRSGMTTKEIDNPQAKEQREQFKDSEGWIYLGTVHHHCSSTAFQSGVDRWDEQSQDGLHITIGKLTDAHWDMHVRFYLSGCEFVPNMANFWDIGEQAKALIPAECFDIVARHQMTAPPPADATFPEQWKANLIDTTPPQRFIGWQQSNFQSGSVGNGNGNSAPDKSGSDSESSLLPEYKRKEKALERLEVACAAAGLPQIEVDAIFSELTDNPIIKAARQTAEEWRVTFWDILKEWEWRKDMRAQFEKNGWEY